MGMTTIVLEPGETGWGWVLAFGVGVGFLIVCATAVSLWLWSAADKSSTVEGWREGTLDASDPLTHRDAAARRRGDRGGVS